MDEETGRRRAKYLTRGEPAANDTANSPAFSLTAKQLAAVVAAAVSDALSHQQELLVDKQSLARRLNCSPAHVDALRKRGLPTVLVGQAVRFEPEAVVAWLKQASNGG
ncbi:MAG TPA: hypothetical protein VGK73_01615 [Polyangiaceae bacterium]